LGLRAEKTKRETERQLRDVAENGDAIRARCKTFAGFVREAWHVLEPSNPLVWSWHLDAICAHLEAISNGKLTPWLIVNIPPGSSKSMIISVLWQAWEWGPRNDQSKRFLTSSFEEGNVKRDTRKTRDLVRSEWFKALWPAVELVRWGETSFANAKTGTREGVAFYSIMGKRGDRIVIDDPHSLKGAESEVQRDGATRNFLEGGLNRLNDQSRSAIVIVMQRVHESDLTGVLLSHKIGFVHLYLPMEFETGRRCMTPIGFIDPRRTDGQLLDPVRFPREAVEKLKKVSAYAWAGQYQQRPAPREGGMFKRSWFADRFLDRDALPEGIRWVRHWDLAATRGKKSPYTAGVLLGKSREGRYYVKDVKRQREDGDAVRRLIKMTAETDTRKVEISLPQDPGQAGKVQAQDFLIQLDGWIAHAEPETGDKETRARPFASQCEAQNVYIVRGDWNEAFLEEICSFPAAAYKDQVDAVSGAYGRLTLTPRIVSSITPLRM
jgi:predicted phage terminase large subunit-like protein